VKQLLLFRAGNITLFERERLLFISGEENITNISEQKEKGKEAEILH